MAKWSSVVPTWTPVAVADATNMTDGGHHTIQGGSATQRVRMCEISIQGQAPSTSSPCILVFGRTSQVATGTLTAARFAAMDPNTAALSSPVLPHTGSATNKSQRSATLGMLLSMSFNAYGGVFRWRAGVEDEAPSLLGNTASLGELSLNAFTGGSPGLIGSEILMEPL